MGTRITQSDKSSAGQASISSILKSSRVLPTESLELYQTDLQALLEELEANTPLKVYLVENIHECLLWIRRYRAQKRNLVLKAIATLLYERQPNLSWKDRMHPDKQAVDHLFEQILEEQGSPELKLLLQSAASTWASLETEAISKCQKSLHELDEQIASQIKMLQNLQAEYERLSNRKLKQEFLRLQVENLRRDVDAIEADQSPAAPG